ncbi:MAG: LuxR C-terminal-related transcriptional regulator [Candidatus Caldatribacteriaceae bacterium]
MKENLTKWCFKNYPEIEAWDEIPDGVSLLDNHFSILKANRTMKEWYACESFPLGEKCYRVYHNRKRLCPWCPTRTTLLQGKATSGIVPYHGKEGEVRGWQKLIVFPIFDGERNIVGVMEYVQDITFARNLEEELCIYRAKTQTLQKEVEFLQALLSRTKSAQEEWQAKWISMVRNIIQPILQFLREDLKSQPQEAYLSAIELFFSYFEKDLITSQNQYSSLFILFTPRELQIISLLLQGKSSKEIAEELSISMKAVEFHRGRIREKLGIRNTKVNLQSYLLNHLHPGNFLGNFQG